MNIHFNSAAPAQDASSPKWSPQQLAFLDWVRNGRGSCVLEAVAGAGKTTVILAAVESLRGSVILSYNKKIAEEIKGKLAKRKIDFKQAEAATVHAIGYRNYRKAFGSERDPVVVDENKTANIFTRLLDGNLLPRRLESYQAAILKIVGYAKQRGVGLPGMGDIGDEGQYRAIIDHFDVAIDSEGLSLVAYESVIDDIIAASMLVLEENNRVTKIIDPEDMIYLTLFHKVRCWQFQNVFLDEAQDTNPIRRAMVAALLRPNGRVIAVGDSRQAIYGFTGADSDSLDLIAEQFDAVRLPLTVTYRCPKAVVAYAQQWVSHIQAHESAPNGKVSETSLESFMGFAGTLSGESAVLCRNTKPLVSLALKLIRAKVACRVEGRDIGKNLKALATRWSSAKTLVALENRLADYLEREREKLTAKRRAQQLQAVEDRVMTLIVLCVDTRKSGKSRVSDLLDVIDGIFANDVTDVLVLSTIHKSKGREWEKVFWLDREGTLPSFYAKQQWELIQEDNLCYVAATRAQSDLIEISVPRDAEEDLGF